MIAERLRRLELYGAEHRHPSEAPTRAHAQLLVFHLADMETCDTAWVFGSSVTWDMWVTKLYTYAVPRRSFTSFLRHTRYDHRLSALFVPFLWQSHHPQARGVGLFMTHLRAKPREYFQKAGVIDLIGEDAIFDNVASAMQHIQIVELEHDWEDMIWQHTYAKCLCGQTVVSSRCPVIYLIHKSLIQPAPTLVTS